MKKMNKKGFTLIEMLVVIAIIAVLVSIIIPVVGNSTAKAEAATNAANLRSAKAALTIGVLNQGAPASDVTITTDADYAKWTGNASDKMPEFKGDNGTFKATISTTGTVTVYFTVGASGEAAGTDRKIEYFADLAGSSAPTEAKKPD